jgi:hypothetical protein
VTVSLKQGMRVLLHLFSNFSWIGTLVDVLITIFCDFRQFFVEKIGVFHTNQIYDTNCAKTGSTYFGQNGNFVA